MSMRAIIMNGVIAKVNPTVESVSPNSLT